MLLYCELTTVSDGTLCGILEIVHYLSQNFVNIKNFLYPFFQRYGSQSTLDYSAHTGSYPYLGDSRTVGKREIPETSSYDPDSEPNFP
jgi:hypothetical protein